MSVVITYKAGEAEGRVIKGILGPFKSVSFNHQNGYPNVWANEDDKGWMIADQDGSGLWIIRSKEGREVGIAVDDLHVFDAAPYVRPDGSMKRTVNGLTLSDVLALATAKKLDAK